MNLDGSERKETEAGKPVLKTAVGFTPVGANPAPSALPSHALSADGV